MYIPVRSQPLEQYKRPAKDSQVKPDAVGWKDTECIGRQCEMRKQGEDKEMSGQMKGERKELQGEK